MEQELFSLVFEGDLREGYNPAAVKERLKDAFRLNEEQVGRLFSGDRVLLGKDIPLSRAKRLQKAFASTGVLCRIRRQKAFHSARYSGHAVPAESPLRAEDIPALFKGAITRMPPALGYRLGLLGVAAGMLALPLLYAVLAAAIGGGALWYAFNAPQFISLRSYLGLFLYATPLVAGGISFLFMLKPLFARPAFRSAPLELSPGKEPLLFTFVHEIADMIGAPRPARVHLDWSVNASASFYDGFKSMKGNELTLTIGMPLIAGMNTRELAGVIAHEFGHFSQGAGMRATYIIRAVLYWFYRCAHQRDAWDAKIEQLSESNDNALGALLMVGRIGIWAVRQVLSALLWLAQLISHYMLRQMEFDADRYEAQVVGSDQFRQTSFRLRVLMHAFDAVYKDLGELWADRKLVDDMPTMVTRKAAEIEPAMRHFMDHYFEDTKTAVFDTHPADAVRIRHAEQVGARGLFHLQRPARVLLGEYDRLARLTSLRYYRGALGLTITEEQLISADAMASTVTDAKRRDQALGEYCRDLFISYRFVRLGAIEAYHTRAEDQRKTDIERLVGKLRTDLPEIRLLVKGYTELSEQLGDSYAAFTLRQEKIRVPAGLATGHPDYESLRRALIGEEQRLKDYEDILTERLALSLSAVAKNGTAATEEIKDLLAAQNCLADIQSLCDQLYLYVAVVHQLRLIARHAAEVEFREREVVPERVIEVRGRYLGETLEKIEKALESLPYPFDRAGGRVSVMYHLREELPAPDLRDFDSLVIYGQELFYAVQQLHRRIMGRLASLAARYEAAIGIAPIRIQG